MAGRRPDYVLKVLDKSNDKRGVLGAAWKNEDGSITIQFNPCIVLDSKDLENKLVNLFPNTEPPGTKAKSSKREEKKKFQDAEDDRPF